MRECVYKIIGVLVGLLIGAVLYAGKLLLIKAVFAP